jgi:putative transposase
VFQRRVRAIGMRDDPMTPTSPWRNGDVDRVIGSIRRECPDHLIVFTADHHQRPLGSDVTYDNSVRNHLTLDKHGPITDQNAASVTFGYSESSRTPSSIGATI